MIIYIKTEVQYPMKILINKLIKKHIYDIKILHFLYERR